MLYVQLRQSLLSAVAGLKKDSLLDRGGGSLSVRCEDRHVLITATGSQFKRWDIDEHDFIVLDLAGNIVEMDEKLGPAGTPVHLALYALFPECGAVLHTHAPYSLAFSSLGIPVPSTTFQMDLLGEVPCLSTDDNRIKELFADASSAPAVTIPQGMIQKPAVAAIGNSLVSQVEEKMLHRRAELARHGLGFTTCRHGVYVFARSLEEAADNLFRIEASARNAIICSGYSDSMARSLLG